MRRGIPMFVKDEIRTFTKKYKKNIATRTELNNRLFQLCDRDKWLKLLKDRALRSQKLYRDNEKLLANIRTRLSGEITARDAESLYDSIFNTFYNRFEISDIPVLMTLADKAVSYYKKTSDYNRLAKLYSILTYWSMEYYTRIRVGKTKRTVDYAYETIALKDHYSEMDDKDARLKIFRTYANLMGNIMDDNKSLRGNFFEIYNEMLGLWNSEVVQKMDGDNEEIKAEVIWMRDNMVYVCACNLMDYEIELPEAEERREKEFIRKALENYDGDKDKSNIYWMADMTLKILNGGITSKDAIHKVIMRTDAVPKPDFEKLSAEENCDILDEKYMMMKLSVCVLRKMNFTEKERTEYGRQITFRFFKDIHKIPNNLYTTYVDDICKEYFSMVRPFLNGIYEKEQKLMQIFFLRQPLTYVHCLLVGSLAYKIGEAMIDKKPFLFAGIGELDSEQDVINKREALLDYIRRAGLIHDVGEIIMPTIINMQTRSLTNEEKDFILMHPQIGVDYLENDNDFLPYMDIILGHHKSYDGKSGYPKEFNNTASPYRIITDVISICDALEIGEDYISRAYKAPKKFDEIVEEIYEGAGTLYNPYIAGMIERDDDLREKLRYIVTEGRIKATQEVYRNIVTCVRYGGSPYFRLNAVDMENEEEQ